MKTISSTIASITMLATLALPAVASTATYSPRMSDTVVTRGDNSDVVFDQHAQTSASGFNDHVYHGGPKVND